MENNKKAVELKICLAFGLIEVNARTLKDVHVKSGTDTADHNECSIHEVLFVGRVIVILEDGTDTLSLNAGNYHLTVHSIPERRKHKISYRLLSVMAQV